MNMDSYAHGSAAELIVRRSPPPRRRSDSRRRRSVAYIVVRKSRVGSLIAFDPSFCFQSLYIFPRGG